MFGLLYRMEDYCLLKFVCYVLMHFPQLLLCQWVVVMKGLIRSAVSFSVLWTGMMQWIDLLSGRFDRYIHNGLIVVWVELCIGQCFPLDSAWLCEKLIFQMVHYVGSQSGHLGRLMLHCMSHLVGLKFEICPVFLGQWDVGLSCDLDSDQSHGCREGQ